MRKLMRKTHQFHNFSLLESAAKLRPFFRTCLEQQQVADEQLWVLGPADKLPRLPSALRDSAHGNSVGLSPSSEGSVSAFFLSLLGKITGNLKDVQKSKEEDVLSPESSAGFTSWTLPSNGLLEGPRTATAYTLQAADCPSCLSCAFSLPGFNPPRDKGGHSDPTPVTGM